MTRDGARRRVRSPAARCCLGEIRFGRPTCRPPVADFRWGTNLSEDWTGRPSTPLRVMVVGLSMTVPPTRDGWATEARRR